MTQLFAPACVTFNILQSRFPFQMPWYVWREATGRWTLLRNHPRKSRPWTRFLANYSRGLGPFFASGNFVVPSNQRMCKIFPTRFCSRTGNQANGFTRTYVVSNAQARWDIGDWKQHVYPNFHFFFFFCLGCKFSLYLSWNSTRRWYIFMCPT